MFKAQSNRSDLAYQENWLGIIIKVYKVKKVNNPATFSVQFSVGNDSIDNLREVPAMTGFQTVPMALEKAKQYINERQWKVERTKYAYDILVRLLYSGVWAYKIVNKFNQKVIDKNYNYTSKEAALFFAEEYLKKQSK
jgi:hypothetical protein